MVALEQPCAEPAGDRDEQRTDIRAVQQRDRRRLAGRRPERQSKHERDTGAQLQKQSECPDNAARESHPCPHDRRSLDRPGCGRPARIECQRNCQGREHDAEGQKALDQQPDVVAASSVKKPSDNEVQRRHRKRTEGHSVLDIAHERALQAGSDERRAEDEAGVHVDSHLHRTAQGVEHRDRDVEQEEHDEERLRRREILGPVPRHAPERPHEEGERESQQIEHAPGLEPRDAENAGVQQCVVAEEHHVIAGLAGRENRREKAAGNRKRGKRDRVLTHREPRRKGRDRHQEPECRQRRDKIVQAQRGEYRQVEDAHATALQHHRVGTPRQAQPPSDDEQRNSAKCNACEAKRNGDLHVLDRVLQQKSDADEQKHHSDPCQRIAAGDPGPKRIREHGRRLLDDRTRRPCGR